MKVLSGGERTRLALLKLLLEPVNLLILDEPTNHLDLRTKDVLKQALADFDGTLICVSHDRDFLDGLITRVYEFGGGQVREHLCGIYEFLEKKKMAELATWNASDNDWQQLDILLFGHGQQPPRGPMSANGQRRHTGADGHLLA